MSKGVCLKGLNVAIDAASEFCADWGIGCSSGRDDCLTGSRGSDREGDRWVEIEDGCQGRALASWAVSNAAMVHILVHKGLEAADDGGLE